MPLARDLRILPAIDAAMTVGSGGINEMAGGTSTQLDAGRLRVSAGTMLFSGGVRLSVDQADLAGRSFAAPVFGSNHGFRLLLDANL